MEGTDSLDSDLVRVSDKEEQPDSREREVIRGRLRDYQRKRKERWKERWGWGGFIRGADKQKSRRWRRQSTERFIDRKRKQEICGVGDRQKHKRQAAKEQNTETETDRNR